MFALYHLWNVIKWVGMIARNETENESGTHGFVQSDQDQAHANQAEVFPGIITGRSAHRLPEDFSQQGDNADPSVDGGDRKRLNTSDNVEEDNQPFPGDCPADVSDKNVCSRDMESSNDGEEERKGCPRFHPPVCFQRYELVERVLKEHKVVSVVDFGSSKCKIIHRLKSVDSVQRIALVDIDQEVLKSNVRCVKPKNSDYLPKRLVPLTVSVLHGSAGDLDGRLFGFQAASMVELIEHLQPDMLEQVTDCVFGRLRPSLVIVTTPNADFNVLFPNLTGFRHWDHKFEWTREQFRQWCSDVCQQHGYSVVYTGVGDPTPGMSHVGFCSQVAIFTESSGKPGEQTDDMPYDVVYEVEYPFDSRTSAERLANEVAVAINGFWYSGDFQSDDDSEVFIPVSLITETILRQEKRDQWTEEQIVEHLQSQYRLTAEGDHVVKLPYYEEESAHSDSYDYEEEEEEQREEWQKGSEDDIADLGPPLSGFDEENWDS